MYKKSILIESKNLILHVQLTDIKYKSEKKNKINIVLQPQLLL